MTEERETGRCPHCGEALRAFALPENTGWSGPVHFACFNDDCGYFRRGWAWMEERYGVKASYRYRMDPATGKDFPLAVWSATALCDRILGEIVPEGPGSAGPAPAGAAR